MGTPEFELGTDGPATPVAGLDRLVVVCADAIVVGAGESAGHRLFGSVAVRTVRAGDWPVTVVP